MKRIAGAVFLILCICLAGFARQKPNFEVWQLPSRINTIGNSYVFRMNNGAVAVMDGGVKDEATYLRGFLAALGNNVDVWFVSHPHPDHIGALDEILKAPNGIQIGKICQSEFSPAFCESEPGCKTIAEEYYANLRKSGIPVVNVAEPGMVIMIDQTCFKILGLKNEDIAVNPYNNSSMVIRVWDNSKSMVFLGDCGKEEGDRLLNGPLRRYLDCDYLQMAHHGQQGASKNFYRTVKLGPACGPLRRGCTTMMWEKDITPTY